MSLGLDALILRNREGGRLEFTTDAARGVDHGLFQLIAVGTPPDEDGSADLRHVLERGPHHRRKTGALRDRRDQVDRAGGHRG